MKRQIILLYGLFCAVLVIFFFSSCSTKQKEMSITTSSEEARQLFIQGREDLQNAEIEKATKLFEDAIKKDSTFALAYLFRAFSGGGSEVLKTNIEKAFLLSDKITEGEQLLIKADKAYNLDNDRKLGREYLKKLLTMFPEDKLAHFSYAVSFFNQGENDSAIVHLKKAIELDAEYAAPHNFLGYAFMNKGENEEAEKEFKEYIRLAPDRPNPYDSYGEFLLKVGKYDESIANYQKAIDMDNSFSSGLYRIGDSYVFKGEYDKAREYYQKYFDKSESVDSKLSALRMRARSYLYENKVMDAVKSFGEYRSYAEKEGKPKEVIMSHAYEGWTLSENGKTTDGLKKCEDAVNSINKVALSKEDKETMLRNSNMWLAYAYSMNNQLNKAKEKAALYKKDVDLRNDPEDKNSLNWVLGLIDFKEGKYDPMIDKYLKISVLEADDKYLLAQAYLKKGDKESAKKLFNEIKNSNENTTQLAIVWNRVKQELGKK